MTIDTKNLLSDLRLYIKTGDSAPAKNLCTQALDALTRKDNLIRGCLGMLIGKYKNEPLVVDSVVKLLEKELGMSTNAPCGECHLKPNERCDICGAKELT